VLDKGVMKKLKGLEALALKEEGEPRLFNDIFGRTDLPKISRRRGGRGDHQRLTSNQRGTLTFAAGDRGVIQKEGRAKWGQSVNRVRTHFRQHK